MKAPISIFLLLCASSILAACEKSHEQKIHDFESDVKNNRLGSSADVWLKKSSILTKNEPVALIFGFMDDYQFCKEIADLYMRRYPESTYECEFANLPWD